MPLLPQEGFQELHTRTPNSLVVRLLSWVAQDSGPNSLCLIQDDAGNSTFLRKVVPACLGYLNIHGAKERRLSSAADEVHYRSNCWAPASSTELHTEWVRAWGWPALLGQAGQYSLWQVRTWDRISWLEERFCKAWVNFSPTGLLIKEPALRNSCEFIPFFDFISSKVCPNY